MDSSNNPPSKNVNTSNMEEFLQAVRDIQNINVDKLTAHLSQVSKQTNPDASETLMPYVGHALESQRRETERLRKKLEEEKEFRQEYFKTFGNKEMKDLNKMIDDMGYEIKKLQKENKKLDEKNKSLEQETRKALTEKDNAVTRLRRQMGNQMTDDTTCTADMSDQSDPNKLGKRYKNLYDAQWADAFEMLTTTKGQNDNSAIEMLLKFLIECHNFAKMKAEKQMNELVLSISGDPSMQVGDAIKRQLKNARKLMDVGIAADQNSKFIQECERYIKGMVRFPTLYLYEKEMKNYLIECFQICWLMAIQDPPSVLGKEVKYDEDFDTGMYKPYTTSGTRVDFVVLPPILLHEGGPVLEKGVAHSIQEKTLHIKTYRNVWDDEETIRIRKQPIGGTAEHYPVQLSSTTTRPLTNNGRLNTILPQTITPSSSSFAHTSYKMELVGTSFKQNTQPDYSGLLFTIGSTSNANSRYARESENKATQGQRGIESYTGSASAMIAREPMNESRQRQEVPSPHAGSARTSYEGEKTSQIHHSTARFETETRGHVSATGQTARPIHEVLEKYEQEEFVSFIHMYDREGEFLTRAHFHDKYDRYLALHQKHLRETFAQE